MWGKSILARYVPGNVFMFVGRAWMSHSRGLSVERVSAAMVYEQALGVGGALLAVAVLFPFWEYRPGITALSLIAIPVLIVLMHPRVFGPLAGWALRLLHRAPLEVTLGFGAVLGVLVLFMLDWLVAGVGAWMLARSITGLGVDSLPLVIVAYALAYVAGMVAFFIPSGIGVREAVLTASLSRELPGGVALTWALLLRLWVTVIELVFVGLVVGAELLVGAEARSERGGGGERGRRDAAAPRPAARSACSPRAGPGARRAADEVLFRRRALYVIGGAIVFAAIYALLSWLKYRAYMDARYDLGNMVQAVYNTAHGHFLEITSGDLKPRQMSRLGSHVDPILALFALPWLVWPSPVMLLVAQSAIVATGAWPAYRLGTRDHTRPAAPARSSPAPTCSTRPSASWSSTSSTPWPSPRRCCSGRSSSWTRTGGSGRRCSSSSPPPARRPCRSSSPSWACTSRCASARSGRWSSRPLGWPGSRPPSGS